MAIQHLEIHGYRSLREVNWKPGNLNLLVGPNGSGKSNLLCVGIDRSQWRGKLAKAINDTDGIVPLLWDSKAASLGWNCASTPWTTVATSNKML